MVYLNYLERFVMSFTNRFYIVRHHGSMVKMENFVDSITSYYQKEELNVVNDQIETPTYTNDLAVKLRNL